MLGHFYASSKTFLPEKLILAIFCRENLIYPILNERKTQKTHII